MASADKPSLPDDTKGYAQHQTHLLLLAILPEAIIEYMLAPLLPFMVKSMTEDPSKVGYLTGLISGSFYFPLLLTNMMWGSLSDRPVPGPRFILVLSVMVCGITTMVLGLTATFWIAVLCRLTAGVFGGHQRSLRAPLGIFTETKSAVHGGIHGGVLTHSIKAEGGLKGRPFLDAYPFFLPCAFGGVLAFAAFAVVSRYLQLRARRGKTEVDVGTFSVWKIFQPLIKAIRPAVMFPVGLYMMIAFCNMSWVTALPLLFASDTVKLSPRSSSFLLTTIAISKLFFQTFAFRILVVNLRVRGAYQVGMMMLIPACIGMKLVGEVMRGDDSHEGAWMFTIMIMLFFGFVEAISYLSVIIMITESVEPGSLGAAHGLAATCAAASRTLAPPLAGTLWQLGLLWEIPWLIFAVIACTGVASIVLVNYFPPTDRKAGYTTVYDDDTELEAFDDEEENYK
ncbi:major facilitator superfamily domain-containing protein [Chytridium lagenaria]|nr:major facilitator superfamily domain-containing protein [Chytridium lagenaria]